MYLVREIMHCKPGKVGEIVKRFKQMEPIIKELGRTAPVRILTDMAGEQFWTVIWEQETPSLEQFRRDGALDRATMRGCKKIMAGYHDARGLREARDLQGRVAAFARDARAVALRRAKAGAVAGGSEQIDPPRRDSLVLGFAFARPACVPQ